MPVMTQKEAGWRMEPPVSVPVATGVSRAATAAALPPDDPPGTSGVFEPFRRLDTTEQHPALNDTQGAGLGLSIVHSIADAHGGHVHATPRPDGGLTVHVRIPATH